jgi:predicted transcriptional regulator
LYSRLRKERVLDHFTRGKIYGFIISNPGVHFSFVKRELKVNNGNLAYHLRVLEREGYLKSRREGANRCFYPTEVPYPKMIGGELVNGKLDQKAEMILDEIEEKPNLTQSELMSYTGIGRSTLSRKLSSMEKMDLINVKRDGNEKRYSLNEKAIERYKVCPYCGKDMKLVSTPHYCPYCKRKIIFSDDS